MRAHARVSAADVAGLASGLLERVARTIGEDAALRLSIEFGGQRLYIPASPRPGSRLVRAVGLEAARYLAARHGGITCQVPRRAGEHARIIRLCKAGKTVRAVAEAVGCTQRHVYDVKRQYRERGGWLPAPRRSRSRSAPAGRAGRRGRRARDPNQLDLFEEVS